MVISNLTLEISSYSNFVHKLYLRDISYQDIYYTLKLKRRKKKLQKIIIEAIIINWASLSFHDTEFKVGDNLM